MKLQLLSISLSSLLFIGCDALGPGEYLTQKDALLTQLKEDTNATFSPSSLLLSEDNSTESAPPVAMTLTMSPQSGTVTFTGAGAVYVPIPNFNGDDVYKILVAGSKFDTEYTVPLRVLPVDDSPILAGTPIREVVAGEKYTFTPYVGDIDTPKKDLLLTALNLPTWVSLDDSKGTLSGTAPLDSNGTSYTDIFLMLSDGNSSTSVGPWSITVLSP